jgi:hypothetical protein
MGLALIAMAGCASSHDEPAPDASPVAPGQFMVTIGSGPLPVQGLVISEPAGIACGQCEQGENEPPCPLPAPTLHGTDCKHAFDAGTQLRIVLAGTSLYAGAVCVYTPKSVVSSPTDSCSFEVTQDTTVIIMGAEAFN